MGQNLTMQVNVHDKKILVISPFENWPLTQGAIVRSHYLVKYLSRTNDVWFAFRGHKGFQKDNKRMIVNSSNRYFQLFNVRFFKKLFDLIRREKIELIVVTHFWSSFHGVLLNLFFRKCLIIDAHNVEYIRFRRIGSPLWPILKILEFIFYQYADQLLCVSDNDRNIFHNSLYIPLEKIQVVPNGANVNNLYNYRVDYIEKKRQLGLKEDEALILFFGSLKHRPNIQAVNIILDDIAPRLSLLTTNWKIVIVGLGQQEFLKSRSKPIQQEIIFAGYADDISAIVKSAHLIISPLISGSGTRFKIIESVATGRRVISTTIGAEGLDRDKFGDGLVIADQWDGFVTEIVKYLDRDQEVEPNPEFVRQYDWDNIFRRMIFTCDK